MCSHYQKAKSIAAGSKMYKMSSRIKREVLLWSAAVCFVFGHSTVMASTHFACNTSYTQLTLTSYEDQVFFEAEKIYSVNFQDQSPRSASQATHDFFMTTWTNNFSNSSERISRNLRGFDHFQTAKNQAYFNKVSSENSYISNTLIYSAQNCITSDLIANKLKFSLLLSNSEHINLFTTHSPHVLAIPLPVIG